MIKVGGLNFKQYIPPTEQEHEHSVANVGRPEGMGSPRRQTNVKKIRNSSGFLIGISGRYVQLSHEKNPLTFHCTGRLIGIVKNGLLIIRT